VAKVEEPKVAPKAEEPKKAEAVAKTEPAAGTAAAKVTAGAWFVQLASVKDTAGAASEYKKLQAKHAGLSGVEYRTQRADLAKGTFYRIQAGPMGKDSATSVCNSIKAKGGSCLVVAK
jgi:cell division septation protein DedD